MCNMFPKFSILIIDLKNKYISVLIWEFGKISTL